MFSPLICVIIMYYYFINYVYFELFPTGIVGSISRAHENMVEGKLLINYGDLYNASINRSPTAYPLNPEASE